MKDHPTLTSVIQSPRPILALAPMQDITDLPFWRLMTRYGGADLYVTEYFRVHAVSRLDRYILRSITENPTGRPVIAQMIGNHIPSLVRTALQLQKLPVAAVDLNLGCPAPIVCRKQAGGGLLRALDHVNAILLALREALHIPLTVNARIGFDSPDELEQILAVFARHPLDLVVIHGRTVKEGLKAPVHLDCIAQTVCALKCPVIANGDMDSVEKCHQMLALTKARGVMVGRGAMRNPWIFRQFREHLDGRPVFSPTGRDMLRYIRELYDETCPPGISECKQVKKMKLYFNHIGPAIERSEVFLFRIRRTATEKEIFDVCTEFLDHDRPLPMNQAVINQSVFPNP